jgi:non-ribosomal peptide synthase protein (TIGR01720 family)
MPLPPAASFLVERGGDWRRFAQTLVLELPPGITAAQLFATLAAVLERHDMLRARLYRDAGGRWRLFADAAGSVRAAELVHRVTFDPGLDERSRTSLAAAALDTALGELDPAEGTVVRFVWLDPADDRTVATGRLLVVVHHIAVDGVSWRILVPDLIAAWAQVAAGRTPVLPAVTTSMRRWSHALEEESRRPGRTAELEYWRDIVRGDDPPLADRPWDPARDLASSVHYTTLELTEAETTALISTVTERYHTGAQEVLLTALVLAVASWCPRDQVLVRLEGHGREAGIAPGADISRTVGWFTALYPARFRLDGIDIADATAGGAHLATAVKAVKEQLRAVPDHGIGYGLLRYSNPATAGALPQAEPGQIVFNYLGNVAAAAIPSELAGLGWLPASDLAELPRTPDPDMPAGGALELDIIVVAGRLRATVGYPQSLLDRGAGTEFVERYAAMLRLLAAHAETAAGGHTPSDFPLVPVEHSDVELWEQRYPGLADIWPLGPMQAEFLAHGPSGARPVDPYVVQLVVTLAGAVDSGRLRVAAQAVLAAHPVLRTAFRTGVARTPSAVVVAEVALPWSEIEVEPDTDIEPLLVADRRARFDFTRPPLIRFTFLRSGTEQARLVVTSHHIVVDGWSVPILVRELLGHYAGAHEILESALPRPSYRDYLEWLRHTDRTAADYAWRAALADAVPTTIAGPPGSGSVPAGETLELDEATGRRIAATAAELGVTVNTVVQVAWALVLGEHTGDSDIVFGATVSGRPAELPGVETMVGLLVNTVPVRIRFDPAEPAATLLTRVQQEQSALARHHHLGPAEIRACATGTARELFDTVLFFESYPADPGPAETTAVDGLTVSGFEWHEATHYPLALWVWPGHRAGGRIRIVAAHWPDRLASDTVRVLLERFRETLTALGARPGAPVGTRAPLPADDVARAR